MIQSIHPTENMPVYQLAEHTPSLAESAFVAAEATVIGRAELADDVSIWPGAVIRADNEPIWIGAGSNVQEGAVLHTDPGCPLISGESPTSAIPPRTPCHRGRGRRRLPGHSR